MGFIDKFINADETSKFTITDPKVVFQNVLKQASGASYTREIKYNLFYDVIAFYGVVDGIGVSTLIANTALAIADAGLTVCVIDTSILAPIQDVLLNTSESVDTETDGEEHLDWFDMPYTRKSPLHVSKIKKNISVLSFKGKKRGVVDFLSTNDSSSLVDIALTSLHSRFDVILIDCCHEMSAVNTACLQQAQQVIQVWNDSPSVIASLENYLNNAVALSCPLDKMRYVVYSKICKDAMGSMDELCNQYRCKHLATNYLSEEIYLLNVIGKTLFMVESTDDLVADYTMCIIDIVRHILNVPLEDEKEAKGTITSEDIMEGKVEGTLHKELKDFNDKFEDEHPEVQIDRNPLGYEVEETYASDLSEIQGDSGTLEAEGVVKDNEEYIGVFEEDNIPSEEEEKTPKKKGIFGGRRKK